MRAANLLLMTSILALLCFSGHTSILVGQDGKPSKVDYPESDIFLFSVTGDGEALKLVGAKNVTARKGYENQPFFTSNSESFLFSQSDDYQTDIFEYFVETGETVRITQTDNMEFSPTPSPDNKIISYVTDGIGANQSIWHITRENPTKQNWTLEGQPEREPIGYYSWNHTINKLIYWSRYGFNIKSVDDLKAAPFYVSGDAMPTTPWIIPRTNRFSFVHRQGNGEVWIKSFDPQTRATTPITILPGSNHHYNWTPTGAIINVRNDELWVWAGANESTSTTWSKVDELEKYGIKNATRVAMSPDGNWLAIVGQASLKTSTEKPVANESTKK